MNIQRLYESVGNVNESKITSLKYKFFKLMLNVFYPFTIKKEYGIDIDSDIIVSLTSFPDRIKTVWVTIETLLHQTKKPGRIILWLAEEQFPNKDDDLPDRLIKLKKYGLEIRYCDNLCPHKKYYYSFKEFPDKQVITVDDDVFYPENLIEELYKLHIKFPNCVCCTWAHEITMKDGKVACYKDWNKCIQTGEIPSFRLIPIGCGGVLYPPNSLSSNVFNKDDIKNMCLRTDDIWLKSMELLEGTRSVRWNKKLPIFFLQIRSQKVGLFHTNIDEKRNDNSFQSIINKYSCIIDRLQ